MGVVKYKEHKARLDRCKGLWQVEKDALGDIKNVTAVDGWNKTGVDNKFWSTGIYYVPVSSWTMEEAGNKRVEIIG